MEGTITVVNNPSYEHPELREVVDKVVQRISELKLDGYDIRVTFVQHNRVTVDVNPVGITDELVDFLKFLDHNATGTLARTGMTQGYFDGYFAQLFRTKLIKAYPTDDFESIENLNMEKINFILEHKGLHYKMIFKHRPFDSSGGKFYWIINTEKEE